VTTTVLAYIPSPAQGVWHLGPVPLRAYAFFIIVGIVAALVIGDRRWEARGGERGVIYDIALWAVPFGLIGGRLYHVITDWRTYFGDDGAGVAGALRIWDGGLGIWGAVALGGVGAWIACRQKGIPLPAFGDAIAPGIVLAQAIGRLGNYFNQELYGRPTTLPWGLEIYERRDAAGALDTLNGASTGQLIEVVHPTFLYELLWNVLVFAALIYIDRRFKIGHGRLFAMYVAGYCVGRFWIELMRSDVATHIAGVRVNSFTSTFVFIGAVVYIMVAPKGREEPASLAGKPEEVEKEDAVEAFAKELTAVAATTGVVAAAKAAGDAEDEDAEAAAEEVTDAAAAEEPEAAERPEEADAALHAEDFAADVPVEDEAAEKPEEADEEAEEAEADAEPEAGLGVVEGEEAVEAQEAAPEAHKAAVEAAEEAEAVADEVAADNEAAVEEAAEGEPGDAEPEEVEPEAEPEEAEPEAVSPEPEGGLGTVEGEEAVEVQEAAPEAHEAAVKAADEAEAVADEAAAEDDEPSSEAAAETEALIAEVAEAPSDEIAEAEEFAEAGEKADAEESDDIEPDEPETEDAEAAVEEAEAEPSAEEAAEAEAAVAEEADSASEDEPRTGVLEATPEPEPTSEPVAPAEVSGGRLRRLFRRDR
jgi:prolipoprotein diacylglyceryl transferase